MSLFTFLMLASLFGSGVYLVLGRRYSEVLIGVALISNGVNALLVESSQPMEDGVDPLPQALVLTAIVIGLALLSFLSAFIFERLQRRDSEMILSSEEELS